MRRASHSRIRFAVLAALSFLAALPLAATAAQRASEAILFQAVEGRAIDRAASRSVAREGLDRADRVVVKFAEGSLIRLRAGRLASLDLAVDLTQVDAFFVRHPELRVERRFLREEAALDQERLDGSIRSGHLLADLNLYYEIHLAAASIPMANSLLEELRALDLVETAFPDPIALPAGVLATSSSSPSPALATAPSPGAARGTVSPGGDPTLVTPDFSGSQGYLGASPSGVNATGVWGFPGGRGATVKLIDIEGGWLWSHEDLPAPFFQGGIQINDPGWRNHGTAVMGEMVGRNNGFGVTGIVSDMQVGCASIGDQSVSSAINMAAANVSVGDLFLIELHAPGPNANGSGQFGYVPMEWWQDNFDAIQTATANGRICIEAGGNGEQNLDDPVYLGLFDRSVRNSGAVLVAAGTPTGLVAEWFTNYGSRIDLNGWGSSVVTTGYGDLQGGPETQWYTSFFSGTSSASPIVSGSVACLQGMSKAHWGVALNANVATAILDATGSPYSGSKRIGPRPNLVAARAMLLEGVGTISGTVRDAVTLLPIPGARIDLPENGSFTLTDAAGHYSLPVLAGSFTVEVTSFFYVDGSVPVTVEPGENAVVDVLLEPRPTGTLAGRVTAEADGAPLANAEVQVVGVPIDAGTTNGAGEYTISGIPEDTGYRVVAGLIPGKGADYRITEIVAEETSTENFVLVDAETFEASNGGFSGQAPWQWGVPTSGPGGAFSGSKLWATNLTGNYGDNQNVFLTTGTFNFSGVPRLYLTFTHWYNNEAGFDGGNLQVSAGLAWSTVEPVGGYPIYFLDGLDGEGGFSGESDGWDPVVYNLTSFAGPTVRVRFHFGSDGGVTAPGWYIDDFAFTTGEDPTSAPEGTLPSVLRLENVQPNPVMGSARIRFELPSTAPVRVRIVDVAGRARRTLLQAPLAAGRHELAWDGLDDAGRETGAGVYFVRLETPGAPAQGTRLVRLR